MAGEGPERKSDRGDGAVDREDGDAARQRPPAAPRSGVVPQSLDRRCNQVGEDEGQERHEQHAGCGELIEDDREDDERRERERWW